MIKAIFFDVDGTLISNNKFGISDNVLEALKQLRTNGIKLFIATGRHYLELEELGINQQFKFDGYLTLNGGYCFNEQDVIFKNPIDKTDVAKIVEYTTRHNLACSFVEADELYINLIDDIVVKAQIFLNTPAPPVMDIQRALVNDVYQIDPFVEDKEMLKLMELAPHCKHTRWYEGGYDVIPKSGGKKDGIKAIIDYYNFDLEEVMAFGDGQNDLEMLSYVGVGVCMANGHEDSKACSDYVTKSVDEDGIVGALEYFGLLEK